MKGKILIITDDPLLVKTLEPKFTQEDFVTCLISDHCLVIEKIPQISPDIIILDITTTPADGYKLHRSLRKDPIAACIPMVFLSDRINLSDQIKGFRMGASDYICKPFDPEDFVARVKKIVRQSKRTAFFDKRADFSGHLRKLKLIDIVQLIEVNHKTGELIFKNLKGKKLGKAFFKEGNLIDAQLGVLQGEEAFYGLMAETEGYFEFFGIPVAVTETITIPNMSILLNGSHLIDEASGITELISDTTCRFFIKSKDVSPDLESKLGAENINYLFQLIEQGHPFKKLLNFGIISKPRAASVLVHLLNEHILEVQKSVTGQITLMDKNLISKIREINTQGLSGVLEINTASSTAKIHFQNGEIFHATYENASGKKALFRILSRKVVGFNFNDHLFSGPKTIKGQLDDLFFEALREIQGLKLIGNHIMGYSIFIHSDRLNRIDNQKTPEELLTILDLAKKHEKIGDILDFCQYSDLKTFKAILKLNNLNLIHISKN